MSSVVVLLSSGLDSTFNFLKAVDQMDVKLAVTFDYGQHSAQKEIEKSKILCKKHGVAHEVVNLPFISRISKSSLNTDESDIPEGEEIKIDDQSSSEESAKRVWVPNRNGVFLNVGASYAEALGAEFVIPGFNLEEAQTFPDNSEDYMNRLDSGFELSTQTGVKVFCFSHKLTKTQIVAEMTGMNPDWSLVWPCYKNQEDICGKCESCQRFLRALAENGVDRNAD